MKGRIRDYKEFWGLSPNVSFESCDVNPVSGTFPQSLPPGNSVVKYSSNRYYQDCKRSGSTWNVHFYPPPQPVT